MAVLGRLLVASAERLDLPDLLSIDSFTAGDFKFLLKSLMKDDKPFILRGFDVINPQDAIGNQSISIRIANSVAFYPGSSAGPFYHGLEEGNPNAQPLVPELRKNATNYVYCTLSTFDTSRDTRAFWDPDLDGAVGGEFTQDINTESVLSVDVNVSVSSFPENTIPIAIVKVGATVIESIEDARDMMFRLGNGGINPDPFSRFNFPNDPSSTYARKEPPTEMTSALDPNPFQGADKNIESLKDWMNAVMTKLAELGGTTFWYEDASTFSLINLFLDSLGTAFTSKGRWDHNSATPGLLSWSEDIRIKNIPDPREIIIRQGNKTLSNNDIMYVDVTREESINTGDIEVEWFNGLNFVNGDVGTFQNLSKGDWIKKSDDRNDLYLRVEEFYANDSLTGGVTSPALAKSIKLSDNYAGINQTQRGVYTKGEYTSAEVSLAQRGSNTLADLGGNLMWLATRQDTIQGISDITTTSLSSIDITEADGITAKITATGHGLQDKDYVTIADSVVGYDGTYQVEVEDVDTFYINTSQTGDELGVANAYYATVTTEAVSTDDGFQLESANHNFNTNDTITIADTSSSFDATYLIGTTTNTTFNIAVGSAIPSVSTGTATLARINVRSELGNVTIIQGESTGIGNEDNENVRQFIGMASSSETHPTYNIPPSYNTLDGAQNYNSEVDDNLTIRVSKLTAMMADKAQDKTIKLLPSGYQSVNNTLNGTAREISFTATPSGTPRLDVVLPSSANNGFVGLTNSFLLEENQAAYIQVDRNNSFSVAHLGLITIANIEDIPLEENTLVLAVRLGTDEVWLWDGFYVSSGITPAPNYLSEIVIQNRNAKLIEGGTWSATGAGGVQDTITAENNTFDSSVSVSEDGEIGQVFQAATTGTLKQIKMRIDNGTGDTVGSLKMNLYAVSGSLPTGSPLKVSTNSVAVNTIGNDQEVTFTFDNLLTLNAGTKYAALLEGDAAYKAEASNTIDINEDNGNNYANGNIVFTSTAGSGWAELPNIDSEFEVTVEETVISNDINLTLDADAYIQIPGLTDERNTIQAQTIVFAADGDVAHVEVLRSAGVATNLPVTVEQIDAVNASLDTIVIARRVGDEIIVGTGTEKLLIDQSMTLDQTSSDQTLSYIGASDTADSDPNYAGPNRTLTQSENLTSAVSSIDTELDKFFGQLRMTADGTSDRVVISGADVTMLDSTVVSQELVSLLLKFDGAQIDFGTGEIFEDDGITPLGVDFTPVTVAANQYRWYSVSMIPDAIDVDGRITAQLLVSPADSDGATADAAPRAVFAGTKKIGQVVVQDNGTGGSGTINSISQSDIVQLGVGSSANDSTAPKMIGGGTFSWDLSSTSLSFTSDIYIEKARLDYVDNTIDQATVSPISLPTTNHVAFIERLNASPGGPNLTVTVDLITNVKDGQVIIARRDGDDVIVGSTSDRLLDSESKKIFAGVSDQLLNIIPAANNADDSGQARLKENTLSPKRVTVTPMSKSVPDGTEYGAQLSSLVLSFDGAEIDFDTGEVFESDGVTPLGINFTPATIAANQYRWYSVTLIPSGVGVDNKISGQILILPADSDGATADAAPRAPFADGINLGQVVVQESGGSIANITQSDIFQLATTGSGGGGTGDASEFVETLKNRLNDSIFEAVTPYVAQTDKDDASLIDASSTGSFDYATSRYKLAGIGDTLVSANLLDSTFLSSDNSINKVELIVKYDDDGIDTGATYEVSRNGGNEYQEITMERVDATSTYRGIHTFDDEAVNQTTDEYAVGNADSTETLTDTVERLGQIFTISNLSVIRDIELYLSKTGAPSGNYYVSVIADDAGSPSSDPNDIAYESAFQPISGLSVGNNTVNLSVDIPLTSGSYHIVVSTDQTYKDNFVAATDEIAVRVDASSPGITVARKFESSSWSALTSSFTYKLDGIELDLRTRITSSVTDVLIEGFGILYEENISNLAFATTVDGITKVSFNAVADNLNSFTMPFYVNPDLMIVHLLGSGQSFRYGDFTIEGGNTIVFPVDQFNNGGVEKVQTIIFDQLRGGAFDNSDVNAALLADNYLGSLNANLDRSVTGRGIKLRADDGTLVEIQITENAGGPGTRSIRIVDQE